MKQRVTGTLNNVYSSNYHFASYNVTKKLKLVPVVSYIKVVTEGVARIPLVNYALKVLVVCARIVIIAKGRPGWAHVHSFPSVYIYDAWV